MKQAPFEAAHAHEWRELEDFLENPGSKAFPPEEMPARYRRLCQSLALAADRRYSPALVDRLNELAPIAAPAPAMAAGPHQIVPVDPPPERGDG